MAENISSDEFQGTPINIRSFGADIFSDNELDFLKKKPQKQEEKKLSISESEKSSIKSKTQEVQEKEQKVENEQIEVSQNITSPETTLASSFVEEKTQEAPPEKLNESFVNEVKEKQEQIQEEKIEDKTEQKPEPEFVQNVQEFQVGQIVKCKVVSIASEGILVDFGFKVEGLIERFNIFVKDGERLEDLFKLGDEIEATILSLEPKDGHVLLSKKLADIERAWAEAYDAFANKKILEARVINSVKGGLVVDYQGIRGFIPASQIHFESTGDQNKMVGKTLPIKVLEINRQQNRVVFSHRLAQEEVKKFKQEKLLSEIEVGQVRRGRVSSIKSFGVFVDLGGLEGLIHISELSWNRVRHPSEVVKVGDEIDVFVIGVDQNKKKISLGLKQLQPDPWVKARELYHVGQIVKGKIARLVKFGAFVELERGLEGLLHLSEMKDPPPSRPEEVVKVGDRVEVKILRVIPEEQKIGLSLKAVEAEKSKTALKEISSEEKKVTLGDIIKEKNLNIEGFQTKEEKSEIKGGVSSAGEEQAQFQSEGPLNSQEKIIQAEETPPLQETPPSATPSQTNSL